jgi:mono/diheme cytochrome c family protein
MSSRRLFTSSQKELSVVDSSRGTFGNVNRTNQRVGHVRFSCPMKFRWNTQITEEKMHRPTFIASLLVFAMGLTLTYASTSSAAPVAGFYSQAQADRGKTAYNKNCSKCHLANLQGAGNAPSLSGEIFLHDYYSVDDLFSKISMSMPADNVHGLNAATYIDIIAYILHTNGLPTGPIDLRADSNAMKAMILRPGSKSSGSVEGGSTTATDAYYLKDQAERGKAFFHGSCSLCHTTDASEVRSNDGSTGRGVWLGDMRLLFLLNSDQFRNRWKNAASLYNKMRTTMPAYDAGGLSKEEYLDILAYFMEANGLPAGTKELKDDLPAMRNMVLETGYKRLFNGDDFTGLHFILGNNCAPRPEGCGQTGPGTTFDVQNHTIHTNGKPHGYMYTDKKYLNFTLKLEYRFTPYPGMESDSEFYGNSGYLIFITKNQVWPKMIEIQGQNSDVLAVLPIDSKVKFTVDSDARRRALLPVGQWNSIEISSKEGQVKNYLNGTLVSIISEHEFKEPGYIGFQSEGADIYWRNLRIKEE